jgi:hypothetical protein
VRAEHREPAFVCHVRLLSVGLDPRSGLIRHRRCVLRCRGTADVLYGALLGRSTKSATRPRLLSERVISASGARSLFFGPALGHRRRRCIPLALKRLQRAGRINARRSPDEHDHLLKLGRAELRYNLVDASLMEQQNSRDNGFGHALGGSPAHIVLELPMKTPCKYVHWPTVGVVSGVGDELIVEADFRRGGNRVAVISLDDLLEPRMRQLSVADDDP